MMKTIDSDIKVDEIPFKNVLEKQQAVRLVLEDLPEWFGLPAATESYIANAASQRLLCASLNGQPVGILALKQTSPSCMEVEVMGVISSLHRKGIGHQLLEMAKQVCQIEGIHFLQVKTVEAGHYPEYDLTNAFYQAEGFEPVEVFLGLWDPCNPCQQYILWLAKR